MKSDNKAVSGPIHESDSKLKKAELDRFYADKTVNAKLKEIVKFLGTKTLADPDYRAYFARYLHWSRGGRRRIGELPVLAQKQRETGSLGQKSHE